MKKNNYRKRKSLIHYIAVFIICVVVAVFVMTITLSLIHFRYELFQGALHGNISDWIMYQIVSGRGII